MKFLKMLNNHFEEYLLVLLMAAEVIIVFAQVVTRFILKSPPRVERGDRPLHVYLARLDRCSLCNEGK